MRRSIGLIMAALTPAVALAIGVAAYAAEPTGILCETTKELGPYIGGPAWVITSGLLADS